MKLHQKIILVASILTLASPAFALDQIVRQWQSLRTDGMGGVFLTTGLYDQNFFGNPARATANPHWKVTILDPTVETSGSTISHISDLTGGGDTLANVAATTGNNLHARIQLGPSVYITPKESKWAFAAGILVSTQTDVEIQQNFSVDEDVYVDAGPAFTIARKLLDDDALSVGATVHYVYRFSSQKTFTFQDLAGGQSLSPSTAAGQGAGPQIDIGGTYRLPFQVLGFDLVGAAAIDNINANAFGSNLNLAPNITGNPVPQNRSIGFGGAMMKSEVGPFTDCVGAIEFSDIGNNPNGGLFRTVHIGTEGRFGVLRGRLGINQGYFTAGVGLILPVALSIEAATYGEEMSLNPGGQEDRRYAIRIALEI